MLHLFCNIKNIWSYSYEYQCFAGVLTEVCFSYAVIAASCAACPELHCERPGCGMLFCYHCKGPWHASQTCDEARRERGESLRQNAPQISSSSENTLKRT